MKLNTLILISSFTTLLASCQTTTSKTLEEFKKVDSSLQESNSAIIDNEYTALYKQIRTKKDKNLQLALLADKIFQATEAASEFIDSLKQKLEELDPSGERIDIGKKLLVNTGTGLELTNKLKSLYVSSISALPDKKESIQADNLFSIATEINANKNWTLKYFDQIPTVAAITILNKFKNDCSNLGVFTLTEIKNKLVN